MNNEPALIDKVALCFGGSRGIGATIVRRFAANAASVALALPIEDVPPNSLPLEMSAVWQTKSAARTGGPVVYRAPEGNPGTKQCPEIQCVQAPRRRKEEAPKGLMRLPLE
jgi:hypothetical protein